MVGRDDQEVILAQPREDLRQSHVELLQGAGIAGNVAAMAVERVKIDIIGEEQAAFGQAPHGFERAIDQGVVAWTLDDLAGAAMREDVTDLADGDDAPPGTFGHIQQRVCRRRHGIVTPVGSARETADGIADEGPRDHTADVEMIDMASGDLAEGQQPLQPEGLLMGRDLQHTVGGGVEDRLAGLDALGAEFGNDLRPRGMALAEHAGKPGFLDDGGDQAGGKAGHFLREIAPVERHGIAGDLPMTRGRVLALGDLGRIAPQGLGHAAFQTGRQRARRRFRSRAEAQARQHGQAQGPGAMLVLARPPCRTGGGDVAERIGSRIAIVPGIISRADAEGIHHQKERAAHLSFLRYVRVRVARLPRPSPPRLPGCDRPRAGWRQRPRPPRRCGHARSPGDGRARPRRQAPPAR